MASILADFFAPGSGLAALATEPAATRNLRRPISLAILGTSPLVLIYTTGIIGVYPRSSAADKPNVGRR
jgi:hypothetical protein